MTRRRAEAAAHHSCSLPILALARSLHDGQVIFFGCRYLGGANNYVSAVGTAVGFFEVRNYTARWDYRVTSTRSSRPYGAKINGIWLPNPISEFRLASITRAWIW